MCDGQVCDASGCYGSCPTSTRCSHIRCRPVQRCPPGQYVQRGGCGCSCRLPALEKCPTGIKIKDYMSVYADEKYIFKHYYALLRSMPPILNKKKKGGKGGRRGKGEEESGRQKVFGDGSDFDAEGDGDGGDGSGRRNRGKKQSEHDRLKNHVKKKLDNFFDDALKQGLLDPNKVKGKKKRSAKYYKEKLGIDIMCPHTCTPLCCEEES